ncbi:glutathione S-transferase family protein [Paracraurococcus lichenis]|uniref:Glutathione S-transferase family protein n=1 Tax=Paracraurococcus lichenis TaxID=3064888 RepID=A0ABT9DU62_9PROT|nr:glutathione S-transferase family protein [Paracraurococcus sp. LOR1-02]MDO9707441.1 glutathione S-transferase family protein [Paracraurococcus sp. LOR1-02]
MRLFFSSGSPFARAVRVALRETGLLPRVEEVETTLRDPRSSLLPHNPVGRVPTLVLADGTALTETALILPFLDTLGGACRLLPPGDLRALADLGRVLGTMDGMAVWNRELRRPAAERSPGVIALEAVRTNRAADALEAEAASGGWALDEPPDAPRIALGCLLGYAERRHRAWTWREGRPALSAWFDAIAARPSFAATIPPVSGI